MGKVNSKDKLMSSMRGDRGSEIKEILSNNTDLVNGYINKNDDHTALCMAAYFGSIITAQVLIELGCDVNKPERKEGSSPLIIAAKRNQKSLILFLIEKGADMNHRNNLNLNALDYAIIHGNYEIAFEILNKFPQMKLKNLDEYLELNNAMKVPCFNIPLLYLNLTDKIEPKSVPSFELSKDERKNLEGKIPDPSETWGNFFRRVMKFELYQPPLVERESVPVEKRFTLFMKMQTKLLELEYDTQITLVEDKMKDLESGSSVAHVDEVELIDTAKKPFRHTNQDNYETPRDQNNKIEIVDCDAKDRKHLHIKDDLNENNQM